MHKSWWCHQMETFSVLLALCAGNSPITSEFPSQRPVMQSFNVFFHLHLNKWFSKHFRCRWFEMPSHWLWSHCNGSSKKNYCHISRTHCTDPPSEGMDCVWCPFHSNRTYPPYTEVITQSISKLTSWVIYVWLFISIVAAVYLNNLFNKPWTAYHWYVMSAVGHGFHDEVMVWEAFPHYWSFVSGIHQLPVDSHHPVIQSLDAFCC